nr:hypothetical protein [Tanacetum cinerariifolium]
MARLYDFRTVIRAVFSSTLKSFAIMTSNLSSPSRNVYSRWGSKSLSSTSGGSSIEDLSDLASQIFSSLRTSGRLHTAKTFDLVWMWLGGDNGNLFLMGFNGIQCNKIMARLQFCDYHNMVAILEKSEHNVDFHPIVDFVEASPLRYALTFKPTIYVSHIRQFWSTARIETTEKGTKILATIDDILKTITESSLRRNLKLKDEEGISSLPDVKLFENLTLMGYNISPNQKFTFQKDEHASPLRNVSQGEACPTNSGFEADQDRANIAKTSTLPHDSAPRVTSPADDEGTRIQVLEDKDRKGANRSGDDAPIKGRRLDVGEEAAERVSDDTEEMATVLASMDAATVLSGRVVEVPTGSGFISTAGPPAAEVPTGSDVVPIIDAQVSRELEEKMARKDQRMSEQIARDAEIIENFIPMGSKEEAERFKRKGIRFEQENEKKLKTSEEVKASEEVPEEKVKEMMQLHLDKEDLNQLWALVKDSLNIRPDSSDKEMELWVELKRLYEPDVEDQLWTHTQNIMHAPVE